MKHPRGGAGRHRIEWIVNAALDEARRQDRRDRDYWGDDRAFGVDLNAEERAQRHLPVWVAEGKAAQPIADKYWTEMFRPDPQKGMKTRSTFAYDRDMIDLYRNPATSIEATLSRSPDLDEAYQQMLQHGLHQGPPEMGER